MTRSELLFFFHCIIHNPKFYYDKVGDLTPKDLDLIYSSLPDENSYEFYDFTVLYRYKLNNSSVIFKGVKATIKPEFDTLNKKLNENLNKNNIPRFIITVFLIVIVGMIV